MEVIQIVPRGFCNGVLSAIKTVINTKELNPTKRIGVLGMIVHNSYVVKMLDELNIKSFTYNKENINDLLDNIDVDILVLTAHGTMKNIYELLESKNIEVIDTTCKYVTNTFKLIEDELENGHEVIYIGKKDHPEANAALSIDTNKVHLASNNDDVDRLELFDSSPLIVNQTTVSLAMIEELTTIIIKKYPLARFSNEQCNATRKRQEAVNNVENNVDIVFIVGDKKSNNTLELYNIAKNNKKDAYLIQDLECLDISTLKGKKLAAVTSGASTPNFITNQIIQFLKQFDENNPQTFNKDKYLKVNYMKII